MPEPVRAEGPTEVLRARALVAYCEGLIAVVVSFAVFDVIVGDLALAVPLVTGGVLCLGILFLFRQTGSFALAANLTPAAAWVTIVGNAALNDGLEAPVLMFLGAVPACALLFGGTRPALVWLGISLAAVIAFFAAEQAGFGFWQTMHPSLILGNRALVLAALALFLLLAFRLQDLLRLWLAEQLHEASAARLRRILDAAGDGFLVVDGSGRILIANEAAWALFDRQHVVGHSLGQLVEGGDRVLQGQSGTVRLKVRRDDGRDFPVDATVSVLRDDRVLVLRDVTERETMLADLEEARDAADAASRAKSSFLAAMSHELRTPLNAVIGYAELLADQIADGEPVSEPHDVERIRGSARHLLALIDQILDLAKVESGQLELEVAPVDLAALLDEIDVIGQALAQARSNRWVVSRDHLPERLDTDAVRLKQVLLNLVSNAAKFTEEGTIELSVTGEGGLVRFVVSDTGIGMTADQAARVWDEFVQADVSVQRRFGGTGLGLSLARRLVTLLGGEIALQTAPGEGSRFEVTLPRT